MITVQPALRPTWIPFVGACKSFSQSHSRFVSACLCIEVLHIKCYFCINATCVIVCGIKYDLRISALLNIVFLFNYCYTEYSYLLYRVFLYKYCYREYYYLLYRVFLFNVALDLIKKIFQGGIISKELWMSRSHVVTVAIFINRGYLKYKIYAINPHVLHELKASIRRDIDCISEDELMHVNAHF